MTPNTRIIARQSAAAGALEVMAQRHEVMFHDGRAAQLHPVHAHGQPMLTLRAVETGARGLHLIDLVKLVRTIDTDLRTGYPIDVPGVVFFTLRGKFKSAAEFHAATERNATGTWWPVLGGYVWQAAANAIDPSVAANATPAQAVPGLPTNWCPA